MMPPRDMALIVAGGTIGFFLAYIFGAFFQWWINRKPLTREEKDLLIQRIEEG